MRALQFGGFILGVFIVSVIPFIHWPFSWLETYFHEVSHGMVAIITGGSVDHIELHWRGSGLCYYYGGWRWLVALSGYVGAVLWGALIYKTANLTKNFASEACIVLVCIIFVSAAFWARDFVTFLIMGIMGSVLCLVIHKAKKRIIHLLLQFIGIYILISAISKPLHLLDGQHIGDGATLADITFVPEVVWVVLWIAFAVWILWRLWLDSSRTVNTITTK